MLSYNRNVSLKNVLDGNFPEKDVKKMSRKNLEKFVLKLVECSSGEGVKNAKNFTGLYKCFCLKQINKPEWWPSERVIEQSLSPDGKYIMELLRFLVYKCCEFFKKSDERLSEQQFINDNDENCRGVKRKVSLINNNEVPNKRRTLMPKNSAKNIGTSESKAVTASNNTIFKTPVIQLNDIFYKSNPEPLMQQGFLKYFDLQSTFTPSVEEPQIPIITTSSIKFNSCSIIPFSSELGRELMKRDNHTFPECLKSRRLERLEWYVNRPLPRYSDIIYDITYLEKKDISFHHFKFPRRNIWQHPGDIEHQKKVLFCKPLKVVIIRENLEEIKHKICQQSRSELKVLLTRMSSKRTKSLVTRIDDRKPGLKHKENCDLSRFV